MSLAEDNVRHALRASIKLSVEDRLLNLETDTAALRITTNGLVVATDAQSVVLTEQTETLNTINQNTADLIEAWNTAGSAWRAVKFISKTSKVIASMVVSVAVFWGVFTHATADNFRKLMEILR